MERLMIETLALHYPSRPPSTITQREPFTAESVSEICKLYRRLNGQPPSRVYRIHLEADSSHDWVAEVYGFCGESINA
jgi:hypothetical protein